MTKRETVSVHVASEKRDVQLTRYTLDDGSFAYSGVLFVAADAAVVHGVLAADPFVLTQEPAHGNIAGSVELSELLDAATPMIDVPADADIQPSSVPSGPPDMSGQLPADPPTEPAPAS